MVIRKVYAYILQEESILIFRHVDEPEAGYQVPGGTVEPGETFEAALEREVHEEAGLVGLTNLRLLGERWLDPPEAWSRDKIHQRFYQAKYPGNPPEKWIHCEDHASDGSGPLLFEFFWVGLRSVPELSGGQGDYLDAITSGMEAS